MGILLSHMTALAVLRLPAMAARLEGLERYAACVPEAPPTAEERSRVALALPGLGSPLDVLISRAGKRGRSRLLRAHVWKGHLPEGSAVEVMPGVCCVSPEHVVVQLAPLLTDLELMVLLAELMGLYAIAPQLERGMLQRRDPITTPGRLLEHLEGLGDASGTARVRRVLGLTCVRSASPRETKLSLRLGLPPRLGGYNLPVLSMNEPLEVRRIHDAMSSGVRKPDILLLAPGGAGDGEAPYRGRAVEYQGRDHLTPERSAEDIRRHNELVALGLDEYWVAAEQYRDLAYMDGLAACLRRDLGIAEPRVSPAEAERRRGLRAALYEELELIDGVSWNGRARERARAETSERPSPEDWDVVPVEAYGL